MYRCGNCGKVSPPGQPRRTHVVYRTVPPGEQAHKQACSDGRVRYSYVRTPERREVAREIPVCPGCERLLADREATREFLEYDGQAPAPVRSGRVVRTVRPG